MSWLHTPPCEDEDMPISDPAVERQKLSIQLVDQFITDMNALIVDSDDLPTFLRLLVDGLGLEWDSSNANACTVRTDVLTTLQQSIEELMNRARMAPVDQPAESETGDGKRRHGVGAEPGIQDNSDHVDNHKNDVVARHTDLVHDDNNDLVEKELADGTGNAKEADEEQDANKTSHPTAEAQTQHDEDSSESEHDKIGSKKKIERMTKKKLPIRDHKAPEPGPSRLEIEIKRLIQLQRPSPIFESPTDDQSNDDFATLANIIKSTCIDQLLWDTKEVSPAQINMLGLVVDSLSLAAFDKVLKAALTTIDLQLNADAEKNAAVHDVLLSPATRSFAICIRRFDKVLNQNDLNDSIRRHLDLNLEHLCLLWTNQAAMQELKSCVGNGKAFSNPYSWLKGQMRGNLVDVEKRLQMVGDANDHLTAVQAMRILQYYQLNVVRPDTTAAYDPWSKRLSESLMRAKKVATFAAFDCGLTALLPHSVKRLESLRITADKAEIGNRGQQKKTRVVNTPLLFYNAIQDVFPFKQHLRLIYHTLVVHLIKGTRVDLGEVEHLRSALIEKNWSRIPESLYEGESSFDTEQHATRDTEQ